jgi:hypothetical protein
MSITVTELVCTLLQMSWPNGASNMEIVSRLSHIMEEKPMFYWECTEIQIQDALVTWIYTIFILIPYLLQLATNHTNKRKKTWPVAKKTQSPPRLFLFFKKSSTRAWPRKVYDQGNQVALFTQAWKFAPTGIEPRTLGCHLDKTLVTLTIWTAHLIGFFEFMTALD